MSTPKLIIANKKYSSWSLRPWLALKVKQIDFVEELSNFDHSTNHAHFWEFSPTKKVPVIVFEEQTVWDSLAILETLAERYPDAGLWPADAQRRAHARAISAEMHSGFPALRAQCPMNMARRPSPVEFSADTQIDIDRIQTLWKDCLDRYGGPFLFGEFGIADAMYAPVVNRFEVYQIATTASSQRYMDAIGQLPAWRQWQTEGQAESWVSEVVDV